jgi:hypothetical protein
MSETVGQNLQALRWQLIRVVQHMKVSRTDRALVGGLGYQVKLANIEDRAVEFNLLI